MASYVPQVKKSVVQRRGDLFDETTHQWWRSPAKRKAGKDNTEEPNLNSD